MKINIKFINQTIINVYMNIFNTSLFHVCVIALFKDLSMEVVRNNRKTVDIATLLCYTLHTSCLMERAP